MYRQRLTSVRAHLMRCGKAECSVYLEMTRTIRRFTKALDTAQDLGYVAGTAGIISMPIFRAYHLQLTLKTR